QKHPRDLTTRAVARSEILRSVTGYRYSWRPWESQDSSQASSAAGPGRDDLASTWSPAPRDVSPAADSPASGRQGVDRNVDDAGDPGFSAAKTCDPEVWLPGR